MCPQVGSPCSAVCAQSQRWGGPRILWALPFSVGGHRWAGSRWQSCRAGLEGRDCGTAGPPRPQDSCGHAAGTQEGFTVWVRVGVDGAVGRLPGPGQAAAMRQVGRCCLDFPIISCSFSSPYGGTCWSSADLEAAGQRGVGGESLCVPEAGAFLARGAKLPATLFMFPTAASHTRGFWSLPARGPQAV